MSEPSVLHLHVRVEWSCSYRLASRMPLSSKQPQLSKIAENKDSKGVGECVYVCERCVCVKGEWMSEWVSQWVIIECVDRYVCVRIMWRVWKVAVCVCMREIKSCFPGPLSRVYQQTHILTQMTPATKRSCVSKSSPSPHSPSVGWGRVGVSNSTQHEIGEAKDRSQPRQKDKCIGNERTQRLTQMFPSTKYSCASKLSWWSRYPPQNCVHQPTITRRIITIDSPWFGRGRGGAQTPQNLKYVNHHFVHISCSHFLVARGPRGFSDRAAIRRVPSSDDENQTHH